MCFHNSLSLSQKQLQSNLGKTVASGLPEWAPVYHVSGFDFPAWPIIGQSKPDEIVYARWGLIPYWAQGAEQSMKLRAGNLNARSETVLEKPSFSKAASSGRCLVPSTGFFEWQTEGKQKRPYFIRPAEGELFMMAGISDVWVDRHTGELIETFALLTTVANPLMATIHNTKKRMPCILPAEQAFSWLRSDLEASRAIGLVVPPFPEKQMGASPVDPGSFARKLHTNVPSISDLFTKPNAALELF